MWCLSIFGFIALFAVASLAVDGFDAGERILNATDAAPKSQTDQAKLVNVLDGRLTFFCSGAIISDRFVLTVATCVTHLKVPQDVLIRTSPISTPNHGGNHLVESIYINPKYTSHLNSNNIAD